MPNDNQCGPHNPHITSVENTLVMLKIDNILHRLENVEKTLIVLEKAIFQNNRNNLEQTYQKEKIEEERLQYAGKPKNDCSRIGIETIDGNLGTLNRVQRTYI